MPFQYRPYQNRYVGTITDLMGRGRDAKAQALITAANAQARAAQVSGQAWGGAIQGIGNIVGAIPGRMQAQQDREMALADRARVIEQQELEDAARADRDRASAMFANRLSGVTPSSAGGIPALEYTTTPALVEGQPVEGPNSMPPVQPLPSRQLGPAKHPYQVKQDGAWLFDMEGFYRAAAEAGPGVLEQAGPFLDQMSRLNDWRKGVIESGKSEARETAKFLLGLDDDDQLLRSVPAAIGMFEGVLDPLVLNSLTGLVEQGDAVGIRKALQAFTDTPSQRITVRPGDRIVDVTTGEVTEGQTLAPTPVGAPITVSRDGKNVLVQRYDDGSLRDLPQGIEPAVDTPRVEAFDVLENEAGEQRYVRKGSPEARNLLENGWRVREPAVASETRPPSQAEYLASTYAGRMVQSEEVFARISDEIVGMNVASFSAQQWADSPTLQSDTMQAYAQAARNFINALLRRESGAVIADSEFDSAEKQYLPLPNDSEDTTRQKAANRQYVTQTMVRSSGAAYKAPGSLGTFAGDQFITQEHYDKDTKENRLMYWHDGADGGEPGWYYHPPGMPFPQDQN